MSPLARLPQITLHVEKFINVVGIVEPELHPKKEETIETDACKASVHLMKGSLPLMLSMCHALGLDNSSETDP